MRILIESEGGTCPNTSIQEQKALPKSSMVAERDGRSVALRRENNSFLCAGFSAERKYGVSGYADIAAKRRLKTLLFRLQLWQARMSGASKDPSHTNIEPQNEHGGG